MMAGSWKRLVLTVAAALAAAQAMGCSTLERTYPEKHLYLIQPEIPSPVMTGLPPRGLVVKTFDVSPANQTNSFVYQYDDVTFKTDYSHEFIAPIPAMITEVFKESLLSSGLFAPLNSAGCPSICYRLSGKVLRVVADHTTPGNPVAAIELRILMEVKEAAGHTGVFSKTYTARQLLGDNSPETLVRGWNKGIASIVSSAIKDLESVINQQKTIPE